MASSREGSFVSLTEALENYAAHHPETVEQLLNWPSTRFDHFYAKFQKRQIIEGLERSKNAMVAALWSNSNWDDDKGSRKSAIASIEEQYEESVEKIKTAGTKRSIAEEEEIDENNPFFSATERGLAKVERRMGYAASSDEEREMDMMKGLDQAE